MERRALGRYLAASTFAAPFLGAVTEAAPAVAATADRMPTAQLPPAPKPSRRSAAEYLLPDAEQTHEMLLVPGTGTLLITQMKPSGIVKVTLGSDGTPAQIYGFPLGAADADAHGLSPSRAYPGLVWCTLEHAGKLLLLDPRPNQPGQAPAVVRTIDVPTGAAGPHSIGEYGPDLWVTCKFSDQVLRINHRQPSLYTLYPTRPHPAFVAQRPGTDEFLVSQDQANALMAVDTRTGQTRQIPIPPEAGTTPVGLIAGPDGSVWTTLLGSQQQGTGTFGRIDAHDTFTWYRLRTPAATRAGLLHLAFPDTPPFTHVWLLGSSIINPNSYDQLVRVAFDNGFQDITAEQCVALPTQLCKAHRVLLLRDSVLATELTTATITQVTSASFANWNRPTSTLPDPADD
ncbi:hypothetical protein KGQ19_19960 [Catenulispora sp. NL8]|uniref:NHL repeat containing protein n=1 Tax=Catenulispora pinistramenti TaxID=2705254 RepID=A0ABS5KT11_9ACTN|nr:hypothetical protein [Catenulispora pinistramenti]MBS2549145.1 hypothetical protein [Catenulispora pinistramenti]